MRERALKAVLVLVGLLFTAGIYPATMALWHPGPADDPGDTMMLSIYFALGIFLLLAVRNPAANRSLIAFTAWSSFAHGTVMAIMGVRNSDRSFLAAAVVLAAIGVTLLALIRPKLQTTSA